MAATLTNWASNNSGVSESSRRALSRVQRIEQERIANGWRWIKLSARTKILVPCDKNGRPTDEGRRMINEIDKTAI